MHQLLSLRFVDFVPGHWGRFSSARYIFGIPLNPGLFTVKEHVIPGGSVYAVSVPQPVNLKPSLRCSLLFKFLQSPSNQRYRRSKSLFYNQHVPFGCNI